MPSVMLDGRYFGDKPSGVGRYCYQVVSAMKEQDASLDWRFVVRKAGDADALGAYPTTTFDALPYGPATSFGLVRRIGREPADLFHSPFHVLPRGLRCRTVMTMHDDFNFNQPAWSNVPFPLSWFEWGYFLAAVPDALRRADRIVCVSQATADALIKRVPSIKGKVRVIHHGVTSRFRHMDDREAVAQACQELLGDRPFFLSIGGISPNKNHERMLEAFASAFPEKSGPMLVRVNRFGSTKRLDRRARQLGVADRVLSLSAPKDDVLVPLYNGALAFTFCSLIEGFGLPILEAMACGCPVITSNRSCLPEVAGTAALFADPLDVADMAKQMRRIADEAELRSDLTERGLERASSFSWQRAAQLHREVYDEALAD